MYRNPRNRLLAVGLMALLGEANKPRPLADIPNTDGFRFTGHRHDGSKLQCVVRKRTYVPGGYSYHAVCVESGRKVFNELIAWSPAEL